MIYQIVLVDGTELDCWAESVENVVEMIFKHSIFIVQENGFPKHSTYIMPERVSHYRFPQNVEGVALPVL